MRIEETHKAGASLRDLDHARRDRMNNPAASTSTASFGICVVVSAASARAQTVTHARDWNKGLALRFDWITKYILHFCGYSKSIR